MGETQITSIETHPLDVSMAMMRGDRKMDMDVKLPITEAIAKM